VQIVRKLAGQHTFVVLPRWWVAERTFARINRCRRTVRDYDCAMAPLPLSDQVGRNSEGGFWV
jgi:transposase